MPCKFLEKKLDALETCGVEGGITNETAQFGDSFIKIYGNELLPNPYLRFYRELVALDVMKDTSVTVPKIISIDISNSSFPRLQISSIPGQTLHSIALSDPNQCSPLIQKAGEVMANIHQQKSQINPKEYFRYFVQRLDTILLRVSSILASQEIESVKVKSFLESKLDENKLLASGVSQLHGDFWFNNILCDKGEISGIIDWEMASRGFSYQDIATFSIDMEEESNLQVDFSNFWGGYNQSVDPDLKKAFVVAQCILFLDNAKITDFDSVEDSFYKKLTRIIKKHV